MKLIKNIFLVTILATSSSYVASETIESTDIENFNNVWATSFDQGNTEALISLYSENAVVFPPHSEILEGRTAIGTYLDALKEIGVNKYTISNVDTYIKDGTVYETAQWEATGTDGVGNVISLEGNISNVFERQTDGSWKIKYQSWN